MSRSALQILAACWLASYIKGDNDLHHEPATRSLRAKKHVFMDNMPELSSRSDLIKRSALSKDHVHELVFVVQQLNMDELTKILHDVSDPSSPNYGHHMSGEQVNSMTMNPIARDAIVAYLHSNGATVKSETMNSEYITAHAPLSVWETVLDTEFYKFHQEQLDGQIEEHVRAEKYSVPSELYEHLDCVFNTIEMPVRFTKSVIYPVTGPEDPSHFSETVSYFGYVTPTVIRGYYNLTDNHGSENSTQSIFGGRLDYLNTDDLSLFQSLDDVYIRQPALNINGHLVTDRSQMPAGADFGEGNLDTQYIIAMSHGSPTTYWSWQVSLAGWLISVSNTIDPPLVLSISYGSNEKYISPAEQRVFSTMAIKLGARGVTIVVASGDDGAVNFESRGGALSKCGYFPVFPASNPYVLSVGATEGGERLIKEVVCSANTTGRISSGGGFSTIYGQPSWQKSAVSDYFSTAAAAGLSPVPGYNRSGRAYPDVSLMGLNYLVMYGGGWVGMAGTSASCPVMAGLISNINAARMALGKGSVGWVTPALYGNAAAFVNDIVSGNNKCSATAPCCTQGYDAVPGWDPASGLGSVNYGKMQDLFVSLGGVGAMTPNPTSTPTLAPTPNPTAKPTSPPTLNPTATPAPTIASSSSPLNRRTAKPTKRPLGKPSRRPTAAKANAEESTTIVSATSAPTPAVISTIAITQTLTGVPLAALSTTDFASAVEFSIITALGPSVLTVTDLTVSSIVSLATSTSTGAASSISTTTKPTRRLLAGVTLMYIITVSDGMTTSSARTALESAVASGSFLMLLKESSGLTFESVTGTTAVDVSPTSAPTTASNQSDRSSSGPSPNALAGGCVAGILVAIGAGFAYFYGVKGGKTDKKQYPAIKEEEVRTIEEGDSIPDSCVACPSSSSSAPSSSSSSSSFTVPTCASPTEESDLPPTGSSGPLSNSNYSIIIGSQELNSNFTVQL